MTMNQNRKEQTVNKKMYAGVWIVLFIATVILLGQRFPGIWKMLNQVGEALVAICRS